MIKTRANRECSGRWVVAVALVVAPRWFWSGACPHPFRAQGHAVRSCTRIVQMARGNHQMHPFGVGAFTPFGFFFFFGVPGCSLPPTPHAPSLITSRRPCTLRGDPEPCRKADLRHRPSGFLPLGSLSLSLSLSFSLLKNVSFSTTRFLKTFSPPFSHPHTWSCCLSLPLSLPLNQHTATGRILSA